MSVVGSPFVALVAEIEQRLKIDGVKNFVTFPTFTFRLNLGDMVFEARDIEQQTGANPAIALREALLNQENFSVLVNQIPQPSADFVGDGRMVWSVYERAITLSDLPINELIDESKLLDITKRFHDYRAKFRGAERATLKGDDATYYTTRTLPPDDLQDNTAWTHLNLDDGGMPTDESSISAGVREWLTRRGLTADSSGTDIIMKGGSIEVFPLTFARPWLNTELFHDRSWRWQGEPLSDGGNPPAGVLPAFITKVIFARKLEIRLDFAAAGSRGMDRKGRLRRKPLVMAPVQPQAMKFIAAKPVKVELAKFRDIAAVAVRDGSGNRALRKANEFENPAVSFPVPIVFHCDPILELLSKGLRLQEIGLKRLEGLRIESLKEISRLERDVRNRKKTLERFPPNLTTVIVRDHRPGKPKKKVLDLRKLRKELLSRQKKLRRLRDQRSKNLVPLKKLKKSVDDLKKQVSHFQLLSTDRSSADDIFVLGFVCENIPKSPNPEEGLFAA